MTSEKTAAEAYGQSIEECREVPNDRLIEILKKVTNDEVWVCSDSEYEFADGTTDVDKGCGPWAKSDEDGCCVSCGNDLEMSTVEAALALPEVG